MGVSDCALLVLVATLLGSGATYWLERKLLSAGEGRGPAGSVRVGTDVAVLNADRWLYHAAPVLALLGVAWAVVVLPFGPEIVGRDLQIGVFYFIVVVDFVVLGLAVGGWGADVRGSIEVYYRITAQLVAYVVPLGLALMGPIMMARSLSTVDIVEAQSGGWFALYQPLGFALYLACALMQSYRRPFLEPFSPHIDGGVLPVYGGWRGAFWRLALSGVLFVVAAMGAVLFLGGYRGPLLSGALGGIFWMTLKTFALVILLAWLGARFRPRSTAEMLSLSWRILIPAGLLNVLVVGGLILLGIGVS